jgi:hypothetical protein
MTRMSMDGRYIIILLFIRIMFVSHFENKLKEATSAKSQGTDHFKANHY